MQTRTGNIKVLAQKRPEEVTALSRF